MEEELMFRFIFLLTFSAFAVVRIYYRSQTIGRKSEKEESLLDPPTIFLSIGILTYFGGIFFYVLIPNWILWAHLDMHIIFRWLGVILGLTSTGLLIWIHHTLGKQYSAKLEIQKDHQLVSSGPYKKVRHPMYTVFILFSFGVALMSSNLLLLISATLIAIPFHWITQNEERMLVEQFGEEYQKYMKQTGRFLPPIRRKD